MFSGFLMSIPSILLILVNGFVFGAVLGQSIISTQLMELVISTLSHGIPEIAAFLIAGGTALNISQHILKKKFKIDKP